MAACSVLNIKCWLKLSTKLRSTSILDTFDK